MRLMVDESAGTAVVQYLRRAGHHVLTVGEAMPRAEDPVVLANSVAENRVLVTNDKDFGELIFRAHQPHVGVPLLRLRDERPPNRVRVVAAVFEWWADRLANRYTVATESEVRFLPPDA